MKPQLFNDSLPKVIFFDAMGTLFDLKSSVGEIYQQFALKYGVEINAIELNNAFVDSYQAAPSLAFPTTELDTLVRQEFIWWKNIVQKTFERVEVLDLFSDFTEFFQELYYYFASEQPWYIYPDVIPCLQYWQKQKIQLGIISNFDSRLITVLKALDLEHFFTSVTISSSAGFAKPDQDIFQIALKKHGFTAQQAWHIGDSKNEDYLGAKNMGIHAFWLNRDGHSLNLENQLPNLSSLG
ncbi:HAD-IA family hydrolase [Waterburya agarophytonicola K14]|uniref:HAD-IA family hydrolase n=1 Tax=Waterburya agarophytonicola KI4 TaxID=2874699 RepID=A0A964BN45_9CYAN|nr:HAD-IA family hydrolase [Waterburya agarophytonicola]MCC0176124.1 HAD-IA family hydrolase [Waterburya agarophytonicola KI4]